MRTELKRYRPWNLTTNELRQCSALSYGSDGALQYQLHRTRRRGDDGWVYFIQNEEGVVLSWALAWSDEVDGGWRAMFWTRKSERRKGYGRRIAMKIKRDHRKVVIWKHDGLSIGFFNKVQSRNRGRYL